MNAHMMTRNAGPTYCWRSVLYFSGGGGAQSVGLRRAWALTEQEQGPLSFAGLLRRLRDEAKLTQEDLAEAAGLSLRAVSDLERGIHRTARKDTALQLAGALGMTESAAVLFAAAARGHTPAADALAVLRGPVPRCDPDRFRAGDCCAERKAVGMQIVNSGAHPTASPITHDNARSAALRALATGVPTTLCDWHRDLTIISRQDCRASKLHAVRKRGPSGQGHSWRWYARW
jgi:transcriptional regulator with XRE-family HTH domain